MKFIGCERDVVFVLENSDFVTPERYETNLNFVSNIVDRLFDIGGQFAVISFHDNPRININFVRDYVGKALLLSAVRLPTKNYSQVFKVHIIANLSMTGDKCHNSTYKFYFCRLTPCSTMVARTIWQMHYELLDWMFLVQQPTDKM